MFSVTMQDGHELGTLFAARHGSDMAFSQAGGGKSTSHSEQYDGLFIDLAHGSVYIGHHTGWLTVNSSVQG
jgi:hypothetical protein